MIACGAAVQMWDLDTFLADGMLRRQNGWEFGTFNCDTCKLMLLANGMLAVVRECSVFIFK